MLVIMFQYHVMYYYCDKLNIMSSGQSGSSNSSNEGSCCNFFHWICYSVSMFLQCLQPSRSLIFLVDVSKIIQLCTMVTESS